MVALFKCQYCGESKPRSGFYVSNGTKTCRSCSRTRAKARRRTDPAVQAYERLRAKTPKRRAHMRRVTEKWQKDNPEKYRCHNIFHGKLYRGQIKRQPCAICGAEKVHAHHHDYSKPLDVVWLCPLHHHRGHADETI